MEAGACLSRATPCSRAGRRRRTPPSAHRGLLLVRPLGPRTALRTVRAGAGLRLLWRASEETLGALAPLPKQGVTSNAFCLGEGGLEDRALPGPLHPLGTRHLTNHQSTR